MLRGVALRLRGTRSLCTAPPLSPHQELKQFVRRNAVQPLIQHHRSSWPDAAPVLPASVADSLVLPPRTVSPDVLRFQMRTSFTHGTDIFYPHMSIHPADYKVALLVLVDDLGLQPRELDVLREMVGARYNLGRRELKLTCDRFTNRVENKRYVTYLLERLLAEAKRLAAEEHEYADEV